jgi:hypothetical protein
MLSSPQLFARIKLSMRRNVPAQPEEIFEQLFRIGLDRVARALLCYSTIA